MTCRRCGNVGHIKHVCAPTDTADGDSEAGDFHSEDVPFILVMEEWAVGAGSEAKMQRTNLSLMHLHMTARIMTSTR